MSKYSSYCLVTFQVDLEVEFKTVTPKQLLAPRTQRRLCVKTVHFSSMVHVHLPLAVCINYYLFDIEACD